MSSPSTTIEEGKSLVQELEFLGQQLTHLEEQTRFSPDLEEPQRKAKCRERRQKVSARLQAIRGGWMKTAGELMQELAPKPEPVAPTSPRVRYEREHALFALADDERERVFRNSVETGDALTFVVVCTAAPHVRLMPAHVVEQVKAAWSTKYSPHGGGEYVALHRVWSDVHDTLVRLQTRVEGETVEVG